MRKRGRPRNVDVPEYAVRDEVIARTVHKLVWWGVPLRRRAAREVARAIGARVENGSPLGTERIEQIYEEWLRRTERTRNRWGFRKQSLEDRRPGLPVRELAVILLANGGDWPDDDLFIPCGDLELTPKAEAGYQRNRLRLRVRLKTG